MDNLRDDYQLLFLHIRLDHVKALLDPTVAYAPLRLLVLSGPGTGKTRATQTAVQEIKRLLLAAGVPASFVKIAAPTGCAAFNRRFNATTIHRLIRYFNVAGWSTVVNDKELARLQKSFSATQLLLFAEVSMIGGQLMGKIDSRLEQAKAGQMTGR